MTSPSGSDRIASRPSPRILFIAGAGRSGSTILHNLLGQLPGVAAVGEVRYIWERGFGANQLCGCGQSFGDCPMWEKVAEAAFGGKSLVPHERLTKLTEQFRIKDLPSAMIPVVGARKLASLRDLLEALSRLYRSIAEVTRAEVIVDSSKNPSFGYLLQRIPDADVKVLHFVRDGRAVAYSWGVRAESQPGMPLRRKSVLESALQWNARNVTAELFLRGDYRRLRYEDFVANPHLELAAISSWIGRSDQELPVSGNRALLGEVNHSVFGNEVRFATGEVALTADERWRTMMAKGDRRLASVVTLPLRLRYGYVGGTLNDTKRAASS